MAHILFTRSAEHWGKNCSNCSDFILRSPFPGLYRTGSKALMETLKMFLEICKIFLLGERLFLELLNYVNRMASERYRLSGSSSQKQEINDLQIKPFYAKTE